MLITDDQRIVDAETDFLKKQIDTAKKDSTDNKKEWEGKEEDNQCVPVNIKILHERCDRQCHQYAEDVSAHHDHVLKTEAQMK